MLNHKGADKARHYLDLLDTARCDGQWHEIPEITRKIGKHAPHLQCLIITAQTERAIAERCSKQIELPSGPAYASPVPTYLSQSIPALVNAIDQEVNFTEDRFQAQICLAWLYITLEQVDQAHSAVYATVPSPIEETPEFFSRRGGITARWTHVCVMKGAYIRGVSYEKKGMTQSAYQAYEIMLSYLQYLPSRFTSNPQHYYWREAVFTRYAMLTSRHVRAHARNPTGLLLPGASIRPASLLTPMRAYAHNWDSTLCARAGRPVFTLRPWKDFYAIVSIIVQHGWVQPFYQSKSRQCIELKVMESVYEHNLLRDVTFPRADQTSRQIEGWVDQVMANWRVMCGSTWQEEDLEGGRIGLGNGVLNILYRASAKTFHSTRVLRHLFTVHAALADFYLASKAFDSYLEILVKGKARVEKSGEAEAELGLDDDATALGTAATGIKMLCNYGRRAEAEKALKVANVVEGWLDKLHPVSSRNSVLRAEVVPPEWVEQQPKPTKAAVPGKALALGYHALGINQSRQARLTYETSSRSDLQTKAMDNFRTALKPEFGQVRNVEMIHSYSFVLAESRNVDAAMVNVKDALATSSIQPNNRFCSGRREFDNDQDEDTHDPDHRFLLMKCWHLLALLTSAREQFPAAVASCEAAFEHYGGKSVLYGDTKPLDSIKGLALSEKKAIIEVKITQLALVEMIDGPEVAVNSCGELLSLYTKFFKSADNPESKVQDPSPSPPPTANGLLRKLRGSILGLPKDQGPKSRNNEVDGQTDKTTSSLLRSYEFPEEVTRPPTISITEEDGAVPENPNHHSHSLSRRVSNKLHKKNSHKAVGSRRLSRNPSPTRPNTSDGVRHSLSLGLPHRTRQNEPTAIDSSGSTSRSNSTPYASDEVGVAISHDLPSIPASPTATSNPPNPIHATPSATENMNHRNPNTHPPAPKPPPPQHDRSPITTSPSALAFLPHPTYSPADESRQALTILTNIWLLIASLYRRGSMPTDAHGALAEATTHVQSIEAAIAARDGSSARSFSTPGYAGAKASDELWADVLAEEGNVHYATEKFELATASYESALCYWPYHVDATIGLSNLLLDEYANRKVKTPAPTPTPLDPVFQQMLVPTLGSLPPHPSTVKPTRELPLQELLPKLAARDRAFGLLSALTKSGQGWDCSEAWSALARAHEASGQVEKAKKAWWWVVELAKNTPVRRWEFAM